VKKVAVPAQGVFQKFLDWLDEGVDSGGEKYLELRHRLVAYFDRKNCVSAEELADETLTRVAEKFQEKGGITNLSPAHYCYVTARFVFLEYLRRAEHRHISLEEQVDAGQRGLEPAVKPQPDPIAAANEKMLDCLDRCLKRLTSEESSLILEYYQGEQQEKIQRRAQIAMRLGVSANALSIRACRIRNKLEAWVRSCCTED
jgi:RNA polymerase sigma factor (sigma-70 family)